MKGHTICFYGKILISIPKLVLVIHVMCTGTLPSFLPFLGNLDKVQEELLYYPQALASVSALAKC